MKTKWKSNKNGVPYDYRGRNRRDDRNELEILLQRHANTPPSQLGLGRTRLSGIDPRHRRPISQAFLSHFGTSVGWKWDRKDLGSPGLLETPLSIVLGTALFGELPQSLATDCRDGYFVLFRDRPEFQKASHTDANVYLPELAHFVSLRPGPASRQAQHRCQYGRS